MNAVGVHQMDPFSAFLSCKMYGISLQLAAVHPLLKAVGAHQMYPFIAFLSCEKYVVLGNLWQLMLCWMITGCRARWCKKVCSKSFIREKGNTCICRKFVHLYITEG